MKNFDVTDLVIPAGLIFILYKAFQKFGIIEESKKVSSVVTPECPRGKEYSRGFFETCDPNYLSQGNLFNDVCQCQTSTTPATTAIKQPEASINPFKDIFDSIRGIISPESSPAVTDYTQQASPIQDYQSGLSHPLDIGAAVNQQLGIPSAITTYTGSYGSSGDTTPAPTQSTLSAAEREEIAYAIQTSPTGHISPSSPYASEFPEFVATGTGGGGGGAR